MLFQKGPEVAKFKVLLFEPIHQVGLDYLAQNEAEVTYAAGFEPDQIVAAVGDVDAIIARAQGYIDGTVMDNAPRLKVVGRHGIGVDNIDVPAATDRGVFVLNTPGAPVEAVAEYIAMGMVAFTRHVVQSDHATRNGDWAYRNQSHGPELLGKTLGIVGFGRIGRRTAEICGLGFGMKILYADAISADPEEEKRLNARQVDLDELLATSDFISLNVPLLDSTHHLIDATAFSKMQPHACLVNCSRGPVIQENALIEALESQKIAGAVIDVYEQEPISPDNPLLKLKNVLLSPHCSGHSVEAAQKMSMVAEDILRVLNGQKPHNPVNHPADPRQPVV